MNRQATIWDEGYHTALFDHGIQLTDESPKSRNPHGRRDAVTGLTDYERAEIRQALTYHFDASECTDDEHGNQALIVETVVERILSRRPERGA